MTGQSVTNPAREQPEERPEAQPPPPIRVLLATDGTDAARAAEEMLRQWSLPAGSAVRLLTVLDAPEWKVPASLAGAEQQWAEQVTRDAEQRLSVPGVTFSRVHRRGVPAVEIMAAADDFGADLIALGSHGRTGLERFLLGSVAERVAQRARQPVLVARDPGAALRGVVVAIDASEHAQQALRWATRLPLPEEVELALCHVVRGYYVPVGPEYVADMDRLLQEAHEAQRNEGMRLLDRAGDYLLQHGRPGTKILREGDPANEILKAVSEHHAGLVILGARGVAGLQALFVGSVADRVLRHAPCSVLLVR